MISMIFKHLKTICKHKAIVCLECMKCGFIWRGLMHDNSKLGLTEFLPSAKYFEGNKNTEKVRNGYYLAWLHHRGHNPHHWEYWIEFDREGKVIANKIPYEYVVEMVCDWVGAGIVYSKGKCEYDEPFGVIFSDMRSNSQRTRRKNRKLFLPNVGRTSQRPPDSQCARAV